MAQEETDISNLCRLRASQIGATLFKNKRGFFRTLDGKRKVRAGMEPNGASDLIGGKPVVITQEMVGKTLAVFSVIEVKTKDGTVSDDQWKFINFVKSIGGFSGVARCPEDVDKIFS